MPNTRLPMRLCALSILALYASAVRALLAGPDADAEAASGTREVTESPFVVTVELDGVFEARKQVEVSLQTAEWSQFQVLEAVEAGTTVHAGDRLVTLDLREIDRAIEELEDGLEQGEIALRESEAELGLLESSLPLDLEAARREMKEADEDFLRFVKIDREASEKSARESLLNSQNHLEYQLEELRQLEKMYKADDLTEETEEIVLKRQRDAVESARRSVDRAKRVLATTLEVTLPRQEKALESKSRRQSLVWKKAEETLPMAVKLKRLGLQKERAEQEKSRERLARLTADREFMQLRSPADGLVYYGRCVEGKWQSGAAAEGKLRRGGQLQQHEVFMTIVDPGSLIVRATVPENQLHRLKPGQKGRILPTGFPRSAVRGSLGKVSMIPRPSGGFSALAKLNRHDGDPPVAAGMTCKLRIVSYAKKKAISIPAAALFTDPLDEEKSFVYFVLGDRVERRTVTPGERIEDRVEILEGLRAGDRIRLEPPK